MTVMIVSCDRLGEAVFFFQSDDPTRGQEFLLKIEKKGYSKQSKKTKNSNTASLGLSAARSSTAIQSELQRIEDEFKRRAARKT